ncbi:MAG: hypothetical protein RJA33_749 [Actinomycetota bacterium]|jgi:sec-independent protein translocase protein TatC
MATKKDGRMPLMDHLRELRRRLFKSALAILTGSILGFYFYTTIIDTLAAPVCDLDSAKVDGAAKCGILTVQGILGPLDLQLKVAALSGIIVTAPFWLYQLWAFIAPALHRKERRYSVAFIAAATPFFAAGATLGYLTLPAAIKFLLKLTPDSLANLVYFDAYLEFVLRIILVFGIAFQLPVFLVTFNLMGFLAGKTILKQWRGWVFGIALFVASFSPSGDPLSLLILTIPLIGLYLIAAGIAILNDRRRAKRDGALIDEDGRITSSGSIEEAKPIDEADIV